MPQSAPSTHTLVALLRGINVGGRNVLPMAGLRALLEQLGLRDVRTYIQSGNALFTLTVQDDQVAGDEAGAGPIADAALAELAQRIGEAIEAGHGFAPRVLLLRAEDLVRALAGTPYPEAQDEPKTVHLFFLAETPTDPDLASLESLQRERERFLLDGRVFFLHTPGGIGRSKLAARVETALGVPATARNARTVAKLVAMLEE